MSVAVRVVPCLDVDAGRVVKGVNFADLRDAGDPAELAAAYAAQGADELAFLDVTATTQDRSTTLDAVARVAENVFVPLAVGGGVRSVEDVAGLLRRGADKVVVNTAAVARPQLVDEVAARFGAQAIVVSVDARRWRPARPGGTESADGHPRPASGFELTTHGGRHGTGLDALDWAAEAARRGAGEILLTSVDADGTRDGFDLELLGAARRSVGVPLTASGGAGVPAHFAAAARAGADALLAASVFHFGDLTVAAVKDALRADGHPVR